MTKEQIDALIAKYDHERKPWPNDTQFDERSASINYALVREFKPTVVVEFGTRFGRCTYDITQALEKNGLPYTYRPYELEDHLRSSAQSYLDALLGEKAPKIGGNTRQATDIPDKIDYLFVDNYHDVETTEWVFDELFKKCVPNALVQIHDLPIKDDFEIGKENEVFPETHIMQERWKNGTLPLQKVYWAFEEGNAMESTWWRKK